MNEGKKEAYVYCGGDIEEGLSEEEGVKHDEHELPLSSLVCERLMNLISGRVAIELIFPSLGALFLAMVILLLFLLIWMMKILAYIMKINKNDPQIPKSPKNL